MAARHGDWPSLADALEPATITDIEQWSSARKLDRTGFLNFLALAAHPSRFMQHVSVQAIDGNPTYFRVTLTGPYTYIDEPATAPAGPCGYKPVELCVQLVTCPDGVPRISLVNDVYDLIYLLQ